MSPEERQQHINTIREFPAKLEALISGLSDEQINTRYMPDEWSVRQIVHHVADSHMNSVIRLKLILTEERPPLKGYNQEAWAELTDNDAVPLEASLYILKGLHQRWVAIFERLTDVQWTRAGMHSEIGEVTPEDLVKMYAEHGENHIAHIKKVLAAGGITV